MRVLLGLYSSAFFPCLFIVVVMNVNIGIGLNAITSRHAYCFNPPVPFKLQRSVELPGMVGRGVTKTTGHENDEDIRSIPIPLTFDEEYNGVLGRVVAGNRWAGDRHTWVIALDDFRTIGQFRPSISSRVLDLHPIHATSWKTLVFNNIAVHQFIETHMRQLYFNYVRSPEFPVTPTPSWYHEDPTGDSLDEVKHRL